MSTPEQQPSGNWWSRRSGGQKAAIIIAVLLVIGAVAGGESTTTEPTGGGGDTAAQQDNPPAGAEEQAPEEPAPEEPADDVQRVGPNQSVTVDGLTWRVTGARATQTIGDQEFGLGSEADGTFVVAEIEVSSSRDESTTLTDDLITLVVGDKSYSADNEGTTAAIGAGEDPLFLEDIGPDSTLESQVVFDVPEQVLNRKPALRFGAESFFSGDEAFIRLPPLG